MQATSTTPSRGAHRTSILRSALAVVGGSIVGATGLLSRAALHNWNAIASGENVPTYLSDAGHVAGTFALLLAASAAGLLLVGAPAWAVLHRLRRRGWAAAVATGLAIGFLGTLAFGWGASSALQLPIVEPAKLWSTALFNTGLCALSALTVWRIAYVRVP